MSRESETEIHPGATGGLPPFIDQYRVLRKLGEGAVGDVYLCDQSQPIRRRVAVKVVKPGMDSARILAWFRSERQMLAIMNHPNIARMLDAGETDSGLPFFVLEYVPGLPISDYCRERRLDLAQRLALFVRVCAAVQHAHQKGVIHRDLKPTNILVTDGDGIPQPKIIDFGISRGPFKDSIESSETGIAGSPEYMSPEQASLSPRALDTRSDIYSLGALLYELVTDCTPLDLRNRGWSLSDLQRTLLESTPLPPSQRLRAASADHLDRLCLASSGCLAEELDWVILKALAEEPAARYATANDLADDLQRLLQREPVLAAKPSLSYGAKKFVQRHKFGASVAAAFAVLLVLFPGVSAWQAYELRSERDRANRETLKAEEVTDFMVNLFALGDPKTGYGPEVPLRQAVDMGAHRIGIALADQPEIQAELLVSISQVYLKMGLFDAAVDAAEEAERFAPAEDAPLRSAILVERAQALRYLERFDDARDTYTEVLELLAERPPFPGALGRLISPPDEGNRHLVDLARVGLAQVAKDEGDLDDSARQFQQLAAMLEEHGETETSLYAKCLNELGQHELYKGNLAAAERRLKDALAIMNRTLGTAAFDTATTRGWLMHVLAQRERHAEAVSIGRENIRILTNVYGEDHEIVARAYNNLAMIFDDLERDDEAEVYYKKALDHFERTRGPDANTTQVVRGNIAAMYLNAERNEEASESYGSLLESLLRTDDKTSVKIADARLGFAVSRARLGDAATALEQVEAAWPSYEKNFGEGTWPMGYAHEARGLALLGLGRIREAREDLELALSLYSAQLGENGSWAKRVRRVLAGAQ